MIRHAISHARLMRESTDRVQIALNSDNPSEQLVANRILENPVAWQQWETEHSGIMRQVALNGFMRTQVAVLKRAAFRLIHRKALFEYLRSREVRGEVRTQIFAHFHPQQSYEHAVVSEHSVYLRKACSYLCTSYVGGEVIRDQRFQDPMRRYEELYSAYFRLYCNTYFESRDCETAAAQSALLPLLKFQLSEWRQAIMSPTMELPRLMRDTEYRPTGDLETMPILEVPLETGQT